jgi:hypothetical protein
MRKQLQKLNTHLARTKNLRRIADIERQVTELKIQAKSAEKPVVLFIASAHITNFGLGAAVGLLTSWALRLSGVPVQYYICQGGLSQCVLGSNRDGIYSLPPCRDCIRHRSSIYPSKHVTEFKSSMQFDDLRANLRKLSWTELMNFNLDGIDYGRLCLPSLRWVERRHRLSPDPFTRTMLEEYIFSAVSLAQNFSDFLKKTSPQAVVAMNGTHFPEAVARQVALNLNIRVVTYESGLRGEMIFFTHGIATEYSINPPQDFVMGDVENQELDAYMKARMKGSVPIAGRYQWQEIEGLSAELMERVRSHRQVITIFTNTVWDTSQAYADRFFDDMFDWLDATLEHAKTNPDVLFIVRAHPDEARPGKESNESVDEWFRQSRYTNLENVVFIPPGVQISSYELINLSGFCIVYNSSIGLEAAAMGKFVLTGGWTRYRNAGVCLDIDSRTDYLKNMSGLLKKQDDPVTPSEWRDRARRFYYFSQFKAVLDFSGLIQHLAGAEYALEMFPLVALRPEHSDNMRIIVDGIVQGREFFAGY